MTGGTGCGGGCDGLAAFMGSDAGPLPKEGRSPNYTPWAPAAQWNALAAFMSGEATGQSAREAGGVAGTPGGWDRGAGLPSFGEVSFSDPSGVAYGEGEGGAGGDYTGGSGHADGGAHWGDAAIAVDEAADLAVAWDSAAAATLAELVPPRETWGICESKIEKKSLERTPSPAVRAQRSPWVVHYGGEARASDAIRTFSEFFDEMPTDACVREFFGNVYGLTLANWDLVRWSVRMVLDTGDWFWGHDRGDRVVEKLLARYDGPKPVAIVFDDQCTHDFLGMRGLRHEWRGYSTQFTRDHARLRGYLKGGDVVQVCSEGTLPGMKIWCDRFAGGLGAVYWRDQNGWAATLLGVEIRTAAALLHELLHCAGVAQGDLWQPDMFLADACPKSYAIEGVFLWAMYQRYKQVFEDADACGVWSVLQQQLRDFPFATPGPEYDFLSSACVYVEPVSTAGQNTSGVGGLGFAVDRGVHIRDLPTDLGGALGPGRGGPGGVGANLGTGGDEPASWVLE